MARSITRTAGVLFLAASSVYSNGVGLAIAATAASPAGGATPADVTLLEDAATVATTSPATAPAAADAGAFDPFGGELAADLPAAATQPTAGTSVSADQVATSPSGTVEIHVNDANLVEVLRMLSLQSQRNIVASKEVKGTVTANLFDVTVREALDAILKANGYAYREKGNFIYVYSAKEIADIERAERQPVTEVIRLYYSNAADVAKLITPMLSKEAGEVSLTPAAKSGIEISNEVGGSDHALEDMLVVKDYPDVLERVRRLVKEIDRRPQQILVEATILRARLNDTNALGVNVTFAGGVDFRTLGAFPAGGAGNPNGFPGGYNEQFDDEPLPGSVVDKGFAIGEVGGGGLKLGVIKNNIGVFIQALEGITDTSVLANPKVLVLNKQKGSVLVGNEDGYRDTTTIAEGGTSSVGSVKFLETGTRLIFRPYIGENGYIRMEVHPEDSSGGINAQGLPSKSTTEVTTNVMVRDGRTIVIGGLFRDETSNTKSQVPGLGSLPLVGALFRQKNERQTREEVIILLTPHIIKDDEGYADASEQAMAEAERVRVGMRKSMMWFGRSRLAESAYENAVNELNKPKPNRNIALWHLDHATRLNPQFVEAIDLKQRTTGREVTATSSSNVRTFVQQAVLAEQARIDARPATQPATIEVVPMSATTRPGLTADAAKPGATTQPAAAVAGAATTQPSGAVALADDTTAATAAPATQPVADASESNLNGDVESSHATAVELMDEEVAHVPATGDDEAAAGTELANAGQTTPATQPATGGAATGGATGGTAPVAVSVLEDEPEVIPVAPAPLAGTTGTTGTSGELVGPVFTEVTDDAATGAPTQMTPVGIPSGSFVSAGTTPAATRPAAPVAVTPVAVSELPEEPAAVVEPSPVVSAPAQGSTVIQTPAGPANVNARVRKIGANGNGRTFEVRVTVETEDAQTEDEPMAVRVRDASVTPAPGATAEQDTAAAEVQTGEVGR